MIDKLKDLTIENKENKDNFPYINLDNDNKYKGWVTNFNLTYLPTQENLSLDLHKELDLFLLFALASAWSRTGAWENALFFIAYLKTEYKDFLEKGLEIKQNERPFVIENYDGIKSRKKVSFRKDFYSSINVLLKNWNVIKAKLQEADDKKDWYIFIDYISSIEGLAAGKRKMKIKIPFILRELRCQNIYTSINGELCCVVDQRVRDAYKNLGVNLPNNYLDASEVVYKDFGDLYDIPAFAYVDFHELKKV